MLYPTTRWPFLLEPTEELRLPRSAPTFQMLVLMPNPPLGSCKGTGPRGAEYVLWSQKLWFAAAILSGKIGEPSSIYLSLDLSFLVCKTRVILEPSSESCLEH